MESLQLNEVVSLFSGCGGSSLGYKLAGFKILSANEFVIEAQNTYRSNFPDTLLLTEDIRNITGEQILELIKKKPKELELLDGSPPCNAFSTAGKGSKNWGRIKHYSDETTQRTDDLYFEFIRILKVIRPKVFLTENVPALVTGKNKGYFNNIFTQMRESGYKVKCTILDASHYHVAQKRRRLFFMGVRNDFNISPSFPSIQTKRSMIVKDVLNDIVNQEWELEEAKDMNRGSKMWLRRIRPGEKGSNAHPNKSYHSLSRISYDRPAPTIIGVSPNSLGNHKRSSLCHPIEDRYLTITELKRIASFPDDFILTGNFCQQWERIARAVPPNLMRAIAIHIRDKILPNICL